MPLLAVLAATASVAAAEPPDPPVTISPADPRTDDVLVAGVAGLPAGPDGLPVTLRWQRNGVDIPGATGTTLDLAAEGHGDRGDTIAVAAGDGDPALASVPVVVRNAPPEVDAGPDPALAREGDEVPLAGSAVDPDGDPLTTAWTVEAGAGVDPGTTCAAADPADPVTSVACTDDGAFAARLTASDGELAAQDAAAITLTNARPVLGSLAVRGGAAPACTGGNDVTVDIAVHDPGANDVVSGRIAWGDGSAEPFSGRLASVVHRFHAGVGVLRVQAADDDGGADVRGSVAGALRLQFRATGPGPDGGPLAGAATVRLGRGIPIEIDLRDCDGAPAPGLRPRVGLVRLTPGPKRIVDEVLPHLGSATSDRMEQDPEDGLYRYVLSTRRSGFTSAPLTPGTYRITVSDPSFGALSSTVTLTGSG